MDDELTTPGHRGRDGGVHVAGAGAWANRWTRAPIFSPSGVVLYEMAHRPAARSQAARHGDRRAIQTLQPARLAGDARRSRRRCAGLLQRMMEKRRRRIGRRAPRKSASISATCRAHRSPAASTRRRPRKAGRLNGLKVGSDIFRGSPAATPAGRQSLRTRSSLRDREPSATAPRSSLILLLAAAAALSGYFGRPASLASRRARLAPAGRFLSITTGEAVFDGALKDALESSSGSRPISTWYRHHRSESTLQLMERSPNEPVTAAVARDICERLGVKAIMQGSIAPLAQPMSSRSKRQIVRPATRSPASRRRRRQDRRAGKRERGDLLASASGSANRSGRLQRFNVPAHKPRPRRSKR